MKKNKYLKHISAALLLLTSAACTDSFIELEPTDVLADNLAFQSMSDVEQVLNGAYGGLVDDDYMSETFLLVPDIAADNATQTSDNQGQQVFFHNHTYSNDDNAISANWARLYQTIERTNIAIEEAVNFEDTFEGQQNQILGQAYALRALVHFDALRLYAGRFEDRSALGVPIKTESRTIEAVPRSTIGEVIEQIEADLAQARTLLQGNDPADLPYKIGFDAINAISARVALYTGDYPQAINFASEVIQGRTLATGADFSGIWTTDSDNGTGEIIWSLGHTAQDDAVGLGLYNPNLDLLSWAPSQSLLGLYDQTNDVRFDAYFQPRPSDPTSFVDAKYRGRTSGGAIANIGLNDVKLFRLSEMYLIRAEAELLENGNTATAAADINDLRRARITGYTDQSFASAADLESAIEIERRKELAFEGHRWFDLKRRNEDVVRGTDCTNSPAISCGLESSNFRWAWPIPQNEVFASGIAQNPGY